MLRRIEAESLLSSGSVWRLGSHLRPVRPAARLIREMYQYTDNNMSNAIVAAIGGLPAWFAFLIEQTPSQALMAALLPFVFFILGKLVDVGIKLFLARLEKRGDSGQTKTDNDRQS